MNTDFDTLPDGSRFAFWDCTTQFRRTWHVAQAARNANDANAGTADAPFQSVAPAAACAEPGDRVLIHAGIYRECVRPARGGTAPDNMISYEAAEGEDVVISAAEPWETDWRPSEEWRRGVHGHGVACAAPTAARVWQGNLPGAVFAGYNPFGMINEPTTYWAREKDAQDEAYILRRGLLFVDDQPLRQVRQPWQVWESPGTVWIEDDGLRLHFRLADDGDPRDHRLTFTAREQAFAPIARGLGYIRVRGLTFEKAGNGFPAPQRGLISANSGHHWIIENNRVLWANAVGIDIADQSPHRGPAPQPVGHHVVRRNLVTDCGICGICGVPGGHLRLVHTLIEHNVLKRNSWHDVESLYENAAIKIHLMRDGLIRHNVIHDNGYGCVIWIDCGNENSRVCANALLGCRRTMVGALFVEASLMPNLVDGNIVLDVTADPRRAHGGGHGIFTQETECVTIRDNVVARTEGGCIFVNRGWVTRNLGTRSASGRKNSVLRNTVTDGALAVMLPNADNRADENIYGTFPPGALRMQSPEERLDRESWQRFYGFDGAGRDAAVRVELDDARTTVTMTVTLDAQPHAITWELDRPFDVAAFIERL